MELRALRYFVELVRQNSFTLAGTKMNVTQPTISKMVKALEHEVGAPLIVRGTRCVELTDVGRLVFASGIEMLSVERQLHDALTDLGSGAHGIVRVGVPPLAGPLVAPLVSAFRARCPDITLRFTEHVSATLEAMLRDGTIDVGFIHPTVATGAAQGLACAPVSSDRLCVVAPRGSKFAGMRGVPLAELASEPFVLYDERCGVDDAIFAACAEAGLKPVVAARANHWDMLAMLVEAGIGLAILPSSHVTMLALQRFAGVPVCTPEMHWRLDVATCSGAYLPRAARAFVELIQENADTPAVVRPSARSLIEERVTPVQAHCGSPSGINRLPFAPA